MYHKRSYFKCLFHFNVYNTIIKVKMVAEKNMHLKNALTVLIAVTNLLLGSLCCSVVKLIKLKVGYQWTYTCKLHYFKYLHYFTLPMCIVNLFKTCPQLSMNSNKFNTYIYKTSIYKCRCTC